MNKITLTDFELVLLKQALLTAENAYDKEGRTSEAENIKNLHIKVDEHAEKSGYLKRK